MTKQQDIKNKFAKTPKRQKQILLGALAVFISTFLPWSSVSMGMLGGFSYSGWHSFGMLSVLASVGLILIWLLPILKIDFKLPIKNLELQKYLVIAMFAGPLLWLFQSGFHFKYLGIGFWIALIASGITVASFFKKIK